MNVDFPTPPFWLLKATNKGSFFIGLNLECTFVWFLSVFISWQCICWCMAIMHCFLACMNTSYAIIHGCSAGYLMLSGNIHCMLIICSPTHLIVHGMDAMYAAMQYCHAACMTARHSGRYCIHIMQHPWLAGNTSYRTLFPCMPSCTVPKVTAIFDTSANIFPTWHQMSSDITRCHMNRSFPIGCQCLILQDRNQTMERNRLRRTAARRKRRAAIRRRRILCSSEQSKLCFRPTKSLLSDKTNLPGCKPGESAPKSRILEKKEVQT